MDTKVTEKSKTSEEFVEELEKLIRSVTNKLHPKNKTESAEPVGAPSITALLRSALKNEMEAADISAYWMMDTPEVDIKLAFARQVGDEGRHYRLLEDRLRNLGEDMKNHNPALEPRSALFEYLKELKDPVERAAAGPFAREAIALVKNEEFIKLCHSLGDEMTAHIYTEMIQEDEKFHHELGRRILKKYCITPEVQERAKKAVQKTLSLAEELQDVATKKLGTAQNPGC